MGTLMNIEERLGTASISAIERLQRKSFLQEIGALPLHKGEALSVSCGNGIWDYFVLSSGKFNRVVATDIVGCPVVPRDIQFLGTYGKWEFHQVDPNKELPFQDETFDLVFSQDVIEHTPKPFLFLREQFRTLKKGGHLIVGTPNLFRPANVTRMALGRLNFPRVIGRDSTIGDYVHVQEFHERHLQLMLEEVGFEKIKIRALFFGIPPYLAFADEPSHGISRTFCHFLQVNAQK